MAENSPTGKRGPGRPPKTETETKPFVKVELTERQLGWLDYLIDSGCYPSKRERILESWAAEKFKALLAAGELPGVLQPNVVPLEGTKSSPESSTGNASKTSESNEHNRSSNQ